MRLAYVCTDRGVPIFGRKGGSIHAQEVIRHLVRAGVDVEIIAARGGGDPPPCLSAVGWHELPRRRGDDDAAKERAALVANEHVRARLLELGPFDAVYERHALWSFAAMEYARDAGIPGVLEVNAPLLEEQRRYRTLVHDAEAAAAVERVFAAASVILAVSDQVAASIAGAYPDAAPVRVNANGVDPARFQPMPPA
ncbi:MAG: glycosyltransferase, partial [Phycisphaerae bacterium]|nr:glycosyltransferase [Phycisphaerae bacterium]